MTYAQLSKLAPRASSEALTSLLRALDEAGLLADRYILAHLLAQVLHESAGLRRVEENLNYSKRALRRVFGKYFTREQAESFARQPERIANRVYAGRMANGPESTGDGWRYRGRGLMQVTGKRNYCLFEEATGHPALAHPERLATFPVAAETVTWYWTTNELSSKVRRHRRLGDRPCLNIITRAVNGGLNGVEDRWQYFEQAARLLDLR